MPSLPVIEKDQVRHAATAPDGGAFDAATTGEHDPARVDYLQRLGDDALILGQRLSEWCGHAPVLEVDLSLANLALDLIGQATNFLSEAGDADQLAFRRDVLDQPAIAPVEQPNGDFATCSITEFAGWSCRRSAIWRGRWLGRCCSRRGSICSTIG